MARDRIGLKPLYYSISDHYFVFSSEFNALNTSNLINFSPNREAYVSYLRHLAVPNSSTGNKNIQKVQPGEFISKYWVTIGISGEYGSGIYISGIYISGIKISN